MLIPVDNNQVLGQYKGMNNTTTQMTVEKVAHYAAAAGGFSYSPAGSKDADMFDSATHRAAQYLIGNGFAYVQERFSNGVDISTLRLTDAGVDAWTSGRLLA